MEAFGGAVEVFLIAASNTLLQSVTTSVVMASVVFSISLPLASVVFSISLPRRKIEFCP